MQQILQGSACSKYGTLRVRTVCIKSAMLANHEQEINEAILLAAVRSGPLATWGTYARAYHAYWPIWPLK